VSGRPGEASMRNVATVSKKAAEKSSELVMLSEAKHRALLCDEQLQSSVAIRITGFQYFQQLDAP